ncbi:MAG: hypothetical protein H7301_00300 [Cryobacterium sp.]|nr:hypothetical protein [Oligoflexia bacterium]
MNSAACHFHSDAAFVFDLDETTVDSTPRRFASLREAAAEVCGREHRPDCGHLSAMKLGALYGMPNRYDSVGFLRRSGVRDPEVVANVVDLAEKIYLSGAYIVEKDRLIPGARDFVRGLKACGAEVFFVSSRSIERQGKQTFQFLLREGMLTKIESRFLLLKPDSEASIDFKGRSTRNIARWVSQHGGRVDGIFENEPENLALWMKNLRGAQPFFVEGAFIKNLPIPREAIRLIDFRER